MIANLVKGAGFSFIVSFISLIAIAQLFPLDFVAEAKAVTIFGSWFSVIFCFQVHTAHLYYHSENDQTYDIFTLCFLLLAIPLCAGCFYLVFPYLYQDTSLSKASLGAYSIFVGLSTLVLVSPSIFTAFKKSAQLPAFLFFFPLSSLTALLVTYFMEWGINEYAISLAILATIIVFFSEWRKLTMFAARNLRHFKASYSKDFVGYAKKISLSIILESLGYRIDKICAAVVATQNFFAKYSVLCFENPLTGIMLSSYGITFVNDYKKGISGKVDEFLNNWALMIRYVTAVTFPTSIFLVANHDWFITTVFGERYLAAGAVFQIYLLTTLVRYAPFQALLRMQGLVHFNVYMAIGFCLCATVVCVIVFLIKFPLIYLAIGYFGGWLAFNSLAIAFFLKQTDIKVSELLGIDVWVMRLTQCAAGLVVTSLLDPSNIFLKLLIFFFVYTALIMLMDKVIRSFVINYILQKAN